MESLSVKKTPIFVVKDPPRMVFAYLFLVIAAGSQFYEFFLRFLETVRTNPKLAVTRGLLAFFLLILLCITIYYVLHSFRMRIYVF